MDTWNVGLWAENPELQLPGYGITPELPTYSYTLPEAVEPVSSGTASSGTDWTGVLDKAIATGGSLLSAWGQLQALDLQRETIATNRAVAMGDLAVRSSTAQSTADLAKIQTGATVEVERARAATQVAKAQAEADAARAGGGTLVVQPSSINLGLVLGGLALAAVIFLKRKKG